MDETCDGTDPEDENSLLETVSDLQGEEIAAPLAAPPPPDPPAETPPPGTQTCPRCSAESVSDTFVTTAQ